MVSTIFQRNDGKKPGIKGGDLPWIAGYDYRILFHSKNQSEIKALYTSDHQSVGSGDTDAR